LLQFFIGEFTLLSERRHSDFAQGYAHYLRGFLFQIQGRGEEARAAFRSAQESYVAYGSHVLEMEAECLSFISSAKTSPEMIRRTRMIIDCLRKEITGHGMEELAVATLGILLKRAGHLAEAQVRLRYSAAICEKKGALQNLHALCLQLADLHFLREEEETARTFFRKWVRLGKENGYIYSVPFTEEALQRVLEHSSASASAEETAYLREVADFYETVHCRSKPEHPLRVAFFGRFRLQIGARELTEKDFKTRKVSGLLKYILARGKIQSREQLASIFWPEADRKSAGTSLRVALYELRKLLSGIGLGFDSEEALLEESKEGFALADAHVLVTDAQELEQLYEEWQKSRPENPLPLLLRICDLYKGPFLESGEYDDWVTIQREYYAGIYSEALHALGEIAVHSSYLPATEYLLKGLEIDPLDALTYSQLIALFEQTGQSERAALLRRRFKKRYKQEMGFDAEV
jgi:DNA-binding SARP family transcriptional activator